MPHKHKRVKTERDKEAQFNLPPTSLATPLPAFTETKADSNKPNSNKRRKRVRVGAIKDDTPKAFLRLMELKSTGKGRNGLDNGESKTAATKRKRTQAIAEADRAETPKEVAAIPTPKIMPGERLGDFAARVDQSIPIIGLARKGVKERQTKHEKKLQKMVNTWKENDAKRLEKAADEWEAEEEKEQEEKEALEAKHGAIPIIQSRKSRKKGVDDDDDPWAELEAIRERPKGLHDVAMAPPIFTNMPKETFKVKGGAKVNVTDVPNAAGSLKRREELGQSRQDVIVQYRKMMALQRAG